MLLFQLSVSITGPSLHMNGYDELKWDEAINIAASVTEVSLQILDSEKHDCDFWPKSILKSEFMTL